MLRCRVAALPRCRVAALPRCRVAALPRCRVAALPRRRVAASPRRRVGKRVAMSVSREPEVVRIFLFDGDADYTVKLKQALEAALFNVDVLPSIDVAFAVLRANRLSVFVWGLRCAHGEAVARLSNMREQGVRTPILAVVGSASEGERREVLIAGADDVLSRSDGREAVVAHAHVLIRRLIWENVVTACDDHLTLNMQTRRLRWAEGESRQTVRLSPLEMDLFLLFLENLGELVGYERIADRLAGPREIWDRNAIHALKKKLVAKLTFVTSSLKFRNVFGEGYILRWVR